MKFFTILIDGVPRLDITGASAATAATRAAKVIGHREWNFYCQEGRARIVQVKLEVMV